MATIETQMIQQHQPRRARSYPQARTTRPRSLWGLIWMAVLQPGMFFRSLPTTDQSRQWLWAGVLILALIAVSTVRQAAQSGQALSTVPAAVDIGMPDTGFSLGGGDLGPIPPGVPPVSPGETGGGGSVGISTEWSTALLAASNIILGWFIQALLLGEVWLFRGYAPRLGRNFTIAVWASLPLGLMAGLQLLYMAAGGTIAGAGLAGFVTSLPGYPQWPAFIQAVAQSLFSHLTLFWVWNLVLLYIGARRALEGRWWSSLMVVAAWVIILAVVPVLTGAVSLPTAADSAVGEGAELGPGELPLDFLDSIPLPEDMSGFSDVEPSTTEETSAPGDVSSLRDGGN